MAVSGDFAELAVITEQFRRLGGDAFLADVNKQLAEECVTQVRLGFRESRDPYGQPWRPLKYRQGKPLRKTGLMANGFRWHDVSARGFAISTPAPYFGFHQNGTQRNPQRMMEPLKERGFGQWSSPLQAVFARAHRRLFRR